MQNNIYIKLEDKLNNLDNIIDYIEKNISLQKTHHTNNLRNIIELDKNKKDALENKLDIINKFSNLIENIIKNKPEPNTINKKLVDYIGYDDYYNL